MFDKNQKYLSIDGFEIKIKTQDKYLGDYLHMGGLAKSVEATVAKRYGSCLHNWSKQSPCDQRSNFKEGHYCHNPTNNPKQL